MHRLQVSKIVMVIFKCFFEPPKIDGNPNVRFFDYINSVFICLVGTVLQHCLKEWKGREQANKLVNFNYKTVASKF